MASVPRGRWPPCCSMLPVTSYGGAPTQRLLRLRLGHVGEKHVLAVQVRGLRRDRPGPAQTVVQGA